MKTFIERIWNAIEGMQDFDEPADFLRVDVSSEDTISRNKRNDPSASLFGLDTRDFDPLGAVRIQEILV
jgi:hypothetical protein